MKTKLLLLLLLPVFCPINRVPAASFTNLNFESIRRPIQFLDPPTDVFVASSQAFPGWTVTVGSRPETLIGYNSVTLGSGSVNLFSKFPPREDGWQNFVTSGSYAASLQTGNGLAALSQIGTIPIDSRSLLFDIVGEGFLISVEGSLAATVQLSQSTTAGGNIYDTYGVDVTSLAGKEVELKFTSAPFDFGVGLDNIRFSPIALVPEPSTWAMFGLGLAALAWKARRSNRP